MWLEKISSTPSTTTTPPSYRRFFVLHPTPPLQDNSNFAPYFPSFTMIFQYLTIITIVSLNCKLLNKYKMSESTTWWYVQTSTGKQLNFKQTLYCKKHTCMFSKLIYFQGARYHKIICFIPLFILIRNSFQFNIFFLWLLWKNTHSQILQNANDCCHA